MIPIEDLVPVPDCVQCGNPLTHQEGHYYSGLGGLMEYLCQSCNTLVVLQCSPVQTRLIWAPNNEPSARRFIATLKAVYQSGRMAVHDHTPPTPQYVRVDTLIKGKWVRIDP